MGTDWIERTAEQDLRVLINSELNVTQQHALAAMKLNSILGSISSRTASRLREVIFPW